MKRSNSHVYHGHQDRLAFWLGIPHLHITEFKLIDLPSNHWSGVPVKPSSTAFGTRFFFWTKFGDLFYCEPNGFPSVFSFLFWGGYFFISCLGCSYIYTSGFGSLIFGCSTFTWLASVCCLWSFFLSCYIISSLDSSSSFFGLLYLFLLCGFCFSFLPLVDYWADYCC